MDDHEQIISGLSDDPVLAHAYLFEHRHPEEMPPYHPRVIRDWHGSARLVIDLLFRGAAKSSIAEEAVVTMACLQLFHNGLVIGETEDRAKERLAAIKHEFETNEAIDALFGSMVGKVWQETHIELSNGLVLTALGRGQSLRGVKHLHYRPDVAFCDDLENEESVRTEIGRLKTRQWYAKTLLPAMTPYARIRMAATPLHPEALAMKLSQQPNAVVHKVPIMFKDPETGEDQSSWPQRYSVGWCLARKQELLDLGEQDTWMQEYMCEAVDESTRLFTADMIRCEPRVRTYEATYAVYDPARTVKATSASTGKVVASWVNNRLIVWEASGKFWKPDEMIDDMFDVDQRYSPILIGVEEDGLNEFILQPLRHAQIARGHALPIRPLKAPKGKVDFIGSLQPFFKAGEVTFAGDRANFKDMEQQLLSFPQGRIDVPNALAYFLRLRPGQPIFEGFNVEHIQEDLKPNATRPLYLAANATSTCTTGALCQIADGVLTVFADFAFQGDPGSSLGWIIREASVAARRKFSVVVPQVHFQPYDNIGVRAAGRTIPIDIDQGGDLIAGRDQIRQMLNSHEKGRPAFRIDSRATWTLRALSGGYAREQDRQTATEGVYKVLAEGLEAFAGLFALGVDRDDDSSVNYAVDARGRRYISARP